MAHTMSASGPAPPELETQSAQASERSPAGVPAVAAGEPAGNRANGGAAAAARVPGGPLCDQCGMAPTKYRCPQCSLRTCSVACVKAHKQEPGLGGDPSKRCTGKRQVTGFVSLDDFDDNTLVSDLGFLEGAQLCRDNAKRFKQGMGIGYGRASRPFPLAQGADVPLLGKPTTPSQAAHGPPRPSPTPASPEGRSAAGAGVIPGSVGSLNGGQGTGDADDGGEGAEGGQMLREGWGPGQGSAGPGRFGRGRGAGGRSRDMHRLEWQAQGLDPRRAQLQQAAAREGVELFFMPMGMSRHRENSSFFDRKKRQILWRVHWRIYGASSKQATGLLASATKPSEPTVKALSALQDGVLSPAQAGSQEIKSGGDPPSAVTAEGGLDQGRQSDGTTGSLLDEHGQPGTCGGKVEGAALNVEGQGEPRESQAEKQDSAGVKGEAGESQTEEQASMGAQEAAQEIGLQDVSAADLAVFQHLASQRPEQELISERVLEREPLQGAFRALNVGRHGTGKGAHHKEDADGSKGGAAQGGASRGSGPPLSLEGAHVFLLLELVPRSSGEDAAEPRRGPKLVKVPLGSTLREVLKSQCIVEHPVLCVFFR